MRVLEQVWSERVALRMLDAAPMEGGGPSQALQRCYPDLAQQAIALVVRTYRSMKGLSGLTPCPWKFRAPHQPFLSKQATLPKQAISHAHPTRCRVSQAGLGLLGLDHRQKVGIDHQVAHAMGVIFVKGVIREPLGNRLNADLGHLGAHPPGHLKGRALLIVARPCG